MVRVGTRMSTMNWAEERGSTTREQGTLGRLPRPSAPWMKSGGASAGLRQGVRTPCVTGISRPPGWWGRAHWLRPGDRHVAKCGRDADQIDFRVRQGEVQGNGVVDTGSVSKITLYGAG